MDGVTGIEYPTDNEGWAHCLTIPRVLNVENGQLKQRPYPALENYVTIKRQH
ncbi:sucrose-6-phosphate hydrolase [Staphylococcus aureus]|nr:sucrose-6-phosphate hydrolase [Staphylococcus aureus]